MRRAIRFPLVLLALTISFSAVATTTNASPVYTGQVCSENVSKLTNEISWSRNLDKVKEEAAKEDKLILWVHMVGKIDGFT